VLLEAVSQLERRHEDLTDIRWNQKGLCGKAAEDEEQESKGVIQCNAYPVHITGLVFLSCGYKTVCRTRSGVSVTCISLMFAVLDIFF